MTKKIKSLGHKSFPTFFFFCRTEGKRSFYTLQDLSMLRVLRKPPSSIEHYERSVQSVRRRESYLVRGGAPVL